MRKGFIEIDAERCKGCFLCVRACPFNVISREGPINSTGTQVPLVAQASLCTACTSCYLVCPDVAITVYEEGEK